MPNEYLNNKEFERVILKFQQSKRDKSRYEMILEDLTGRRSPDAEVLRKKEHEYQEVLREHMDCQSQLAFNFFKLAENIIRYRKFHFVDPDDAIQEFVMICFEKIDRFDRLKGKAFNYMTTCILNHYRQLYRTNRNYNELKRKYHDHLSVQSDAYSGRRQSFTIGKDKFARNN